MSILGALVLTAVMFITGRELARWAPPRASRATAALTTVVPPVMIGTVAIILVNQPVPIPGFALARAGEQTLRPGALREVLGCQQRWQRRRFP